tara:strand:- start:1674 stop:2870 length:1197 start_codon:yes stop_codon:yes gene_type:complete
MFSKKIFITGMSRGGATVLAKMLSVNKDINITIGPFLMEILRLQRNLVLNKFDKKKYPFNFTSKLPFQDYYFSDQSIKALDSIINSSGKIKLPKKIWKRQLSLIKERWSIVNKDIIKHINKIYNPNVTKLINNCFEAVNTTRSIKNKKNIGTLDSWIIEMFLPLAKMFKKSKFIVVVRDPRASVASSISVGKHNIPNSLSFIKCWRKMIALTIYYKSLKIFKNRLYVVKHEDLVTNPKKICKKLCNFLNIEFDKSMLNTRNYLDYSTGKIWTGNSTFEKKTFGFSKKRTIRWKKILSPNQIKVIEFVAQHEMKLLNYKFDKNNDMSKLRKGFSYLIKDDRNKRKWKTTANTTEFDYGAEFFKSYLFDVNSVLKDQSLIRRLFLFEEVYNKIRKKKSVF